MEQKKLTGYPSEDRPWLQYYRETESRLNITDSEEYVNSGNFQTMYKSILDANKDRMDYIALEYFGTKISYKELFGKINHVAGALIEFGIKQGDYVSICLPNIPESVYFTYALNRIGAVACLIDPRTNAEGIKERINDANSKLFITVIDILNAKINAIAEKIVSKNIVVVSPSDSVKMVSTKAALVRLAYCLKRKNFDSKKYIAYREFIKCSKPLTDAPYIQMEANMPAVVVYTSGTTGTPKGVVLTNENAIATGKICEIGAYPVSGNGIFLGVIPFFVAYGALTGVYNSLYHGLNIVCIPKFNPKDFGRLIIKHKSNSALGVPRFWSEFADDNVSCDLSFLINAICGGDKISPYSVEKINNYLAANGGNRLKAGYGASEFGGGIVINSDKELLKTDSAGRILPGAIGMVIDPETNEELPYDQDGELCFHSPTMMLGYLNCEEETKQITLYKNGIKYYRTGDKGHIASDGTVYIVDRYKQVMLRPDGHTVHATAIENVIIQHEAVLKCAVAGIAIDDKEGAIPTAFIMLKDTYEKSNTIEEIERMCSQKIAERDKALAYVVVDELPYTPMGKVDYKKLEENSFSNLDCTIMDYTFFESEKK